MNMLKKSLEAGIGLLALAAVAVVTGCGGGGGGGGSAGASQSGLYIAGVMYDATNVPRAGYWKDSIWHSLPQPASSTSSATSLFFDGNDLYVTGFVRDYTNVIPASAVNVAGYWKNDVWHALPALAAGKNANAADALVSASGVAVVGTAVNSGGTTVAVQWVDDGISTTVSQLTNGASAGTVTASGVHPAVANLIIGGQDNISSSANYWEGGVLKSATGLSAGAITGNGAVMEMAVSGADVYATGYVFTGMANAAGYWKNTVWTALTCLGSGNCFGSGIVVNGADTYISGQSDAGGAVFKAVYWMNGASTILPPLSTAGGESSNATEILVSGLDIYVVGSSNNAAGSAKPVFWKNGVITELPSTSLGQSSAYVAAGKFAVK